MCFMTLKALKRNFSIPDLTQAWQFSFCFVFFFPPGINRNGSQMLSLLPAAFGHLWQAFVAKATLSIPCLWLVCVPSIQDVSFNLVQLFPEKAARLKVQEAPVASPSESGQKERENVSSASHSLIRESDMTSSLSPSFQFATSSKKPCRIVTRRRHVRHTVPLLCCAFCSGQPAHLWLITSTLPYCSIHSWPTMMLWTQHVGLVHV